MPIACAMALPEVCKKPATPCFTYIQENRQVIRAREDMQGKGLGAVSKKGAELYNALPEADKKQYQDKYEEEMRAYKEWAQTDAGKAALARKNDVARDKKAARKAKFGKKQAKLAQQNARAEAGCPKKPMTPCFAYIQDHRTEISEHSDVKGKGLGAVSKKGTELFKALPASEREKYESKYEEEKKAYEEWFKSDAGEAFIAKQKEAKEAAKVAAKEAKEAAKAVAKEAKEAAKAAAKESKDAAKAAAKIDAKECKTPNKRSKSGDAGTPGKRSRGRGAGHPNGSAASAQTFIEADVLAEAGKLGYEMQLKNLAGRLEVVSSGKSASDMLKALTQTKGLVNPAKRVLLGA